MFGWGKVKPAVAYAGVSVRTMRDWLKMGLKHSRVQGCVLIRYSDVDAYSDAIRHLIPIDSATPFRRKPPPDSDRFRHP